MIADRYVLVARSALGDRPVPGGTAARSFGCSCPWSSDSDQAYIDPECIIHRVEQS